MKTVLDETRRQLAGEAPTAGLPPLALPPAVARPQPVWLVDCGSFAEARTRYPALRARTHLTALKELGCPAAVMSAADMQLNPQVAEETYRDSPLPLTSCNLVSNQPWCKIEPFVEFAAGWYLVGLSTWAPIKDPQPMATWWTLQDPLASVQAVMTQLPAGARVIVTAVNQPPAVIAELAKLPVSLVIGGMALLPPAVEGGATVVPDPGSRAQVVPLISLSRVAGEPAVGLHWQEVLGEQWPDAPAALAWIKDEREAVKQLLTQDYPANPEGWRGAQWGMEDQFLPPRARKNPPPMYVGAEQCGACHAAAVKVWEKSRHRQAFQSLVDRQATETLDCLECHTTGLLDFTGYNPLFRVPAVETVSCEACHGPASKHVELMQAGEQPADGDLKITRGSLESCLGCHDPYNSPNFQSQTYWEKIRH